MRRRILAGLTGLVISLITVVSVSAFTLADGSTGWSSLTGNFSSLRLYYATATTNISGGQVHWTLGATSTLSGVGGETADPIVRKMALFP